MVEPLTDDPGELKKVIEPPATGLLNAVTIELLLWIEAPVAVIFPERLRNVTEPAVFRFRFVNVLLFTVRVADPA
jgi:hypothetical protein